MEERILVFADACICLRAVCLLDYGRLFCRTALVPVW